MLNAARRRGLILAVILSGGLHGLAILLLCVVRGPGDETAPITRQTAYEPYERSLNASTHLFRFRPVHAAAPQPDQDRFEPVLVASERPTENKAPAELPTVERRASDQRAPSAGQTATNSSRSGPGDAAPTGSTLFPTGAEAKSVVFVLDRSLSMGINGGLQRARAEVCACLSALSPTVRFQVVPYDDAPQVWPLSVEGHRDLLEAAPATVAAMIEQVIALRAQGGTNHLAGLRCGLALRPEIVYFVTDADDFGEAQAKATLQLNVGHCKIEVVHLTAAPGCEESLRRLAAATGGSYRKLRPDQNLERAERTSTSPVGTWRGE